LPGLFYCRGRAGPAVLLDAHGPRVCAGPSREGNIMTETYSKSRQQAEKAFGATQTQFFANAHAVEELDSITKARDDKTARLREARLQRDLQDSLKPAAAPSKRVKKP
jgi:hypothetical protein